MPLASADNGSLVLYGTTVHLAIGSTGTAAEPLAISQARTPAVPLASASSSSLAMRGPAAHLTVGSTGAAAAPLALVGILSLASHGSTAHLGKPHPVSLKSFRCPRMLSWG